VYDTGSELSCVLEVMVEVDGGWCWYGGEIRCRATNQITPCRVCARVGLSDRRLTRHVLLSLFLSIIHHFILDSSKSLPLSGDVAMHCVCGVPAWPGKDQTPTDIAIAVGSLSGLIG
jgi:hypothetical protein